MTTLVTENLPLLANAPNGISKVRALVLDLAVRGKLSVQQPEDGSASDLIVQIEHARSSLIGRGLLKAQKELPEIAAGDAPFSIPCNWAWARLGSITNFGTTDKRGEIEPRSWILDLEDIEKETSRLLRKVRFAERQSLSDKNGFAAGDVLYGKLRPYLNKVIVADEPGFCTTEILPFRCHGPWHAGYFKIALQSPNFLSYVNGKSYGMKMPRLGTEDGRMAVLPLPPLAEQARIVAKVDELMALCDRLEAEQADAEAAHAKLVEALLASLTQARDAADFRASWQQLTEHFHTLFTTEASVDALKQAVLTFALKGLLTLQDADERSGADLVAEVNLKRMAQAASGRLRSVDAAEPAARAEVPYTFPASWGLARMCELCEPITSGTTPPSNEMVPEAGVPFLKVYNIRDQQIDFTYKPQFVNPEFHRQKMGRSSLKPFDVVMNIVGPPLGKVAIIPEDYPAWNCNQAIVFFRAISPISHQYLYLFLCEGSFLKGIELIGTAGQDNISVTKSRNIPVPVPPVPEQHRIVAKVVELLDICDQLKLNIAQARQRHEHLASVLVEHAIA